MGMVMNICETDLTVREYRDQRVVTLIDIDVVHQKRRGTAARYYNQNKTKFVEGVDFFTNTGYGKSGNCKLFTISGYTLLVKQFIGDKDHHIMREMINQYFVPVKTEEKEGDNVVNEVEGVSIFNNAEFGSIRTVVIDGEPWFVGKDVAAALGYKNTKDALLSHVDGEDKRILQRSEIATLENHLPKEVFPVEFVSGDIPNRGLTIINESGVYSLIFGSKLPSAKKFKHWVTSEVLPALRKTGTYSMEPDVEVKVKETIREEKPDDFLEAARIMASVQLESSQPYVVNCLRHVVSDIDAVVTLSTPAESKTESHANSEQKTEITVKTKQKPQYYKQGVAIDIEKLKLAMAVKHLSKEEIAAKMKVSVSSVSNWLSGDNKPLPENRTKLCIALGEDKNFLTPKRKRRTKE